MCCNSPCNFDKELLNFIVGKLHLQMFSKKYKYQQQIGVISLFVCVMCVHVCECVVVVCCLLMRCLLLLLLVGALFAVVVVVV